MKRPMDCQRITPSHRRKSNSWWSSRPLSHMGCGLQETGDDHWQSSSHHLASWDPVSSPWFIAFSSGLFIFSFCSNVSLKVRGELKSLFSLFFFHHQLVLPVCNDLDTLQRVCCWHVSWCASGPEFLCMFVRNQPEGGTGNAKIARGRQNFERMVGWPPRKRKSHKKKTLLNLRKDFFLWGTMDGRLINCKSLLTSTW